MNKLVIRGRQEFLGMDIPVIEGGFGEGKKVMLAKTIAEVHGEEPRVINQIINRNLDEFEFGVDIIDLKQGITNCDSSQNVVDMLVQTGFTIQAIRACKNIYLLSEQGYMSLVMLMKTEKAKEIRKQLRREYFSMREALKPQLPQDYLSALKALVESEEEKQRLSLEKAKIEEEKNRLIHQGKLYTTTEIAKELGFKSAKAFNEFLKEKKIQYKVNDTWVLAARFSELGYTEIKQTELDNGKIIYNRKWTGTGRDWLINEIMKGEK